MTEVVAIVVGLALIAAAAVAGVEPAIIAVGGVAVAIAVVSLIIRKRRR